MAIAGMKPKQKPLVPRRQFERMRRAIEAKSKPWIQRHIRNRQRIVRKWQKIHRPRFGSKLKLGRQVEITIIVLNSEQVLHPVYGGTVGLLWIWWEHTGTKAHEITSRSPSGVLRFIPRGETDPVFAKLVNHPGTKPHHKTTGINRRLATKIPKWLDPAVAAAFMK